jgi:hypothetical protein
MDSMKYIFYYCTEIFIELFVMLLKFFKYPNYYLLHHNNLHFQALFHIYSSYFNVIWISNGLHAFNLNK